MQVFMGNLRLVHSGQLAACRFSPPNPSIWRTPLMLNYMDSPRSSPRIRSTRNIILARVTMTQQQAVCRAAV